MSCRDTGLVYDREEHWYIWVLDMGVGTGYDGMWGEGFGSAHGGFADLRAMRLGLQDLFWCLYSF
jgi:hypothetical protein